MDRYVAMQTFCRVVEAGGFTAAARALDLSNSVVTKHIQLLEDWTRCRLLARTTRSMQVTESGQRFYAYCQRVLADTEETLTAVQLAQQRLSGRLAIASPVSLTLTFLHDQLHAFRERYPGIELEVRLNDQRVDLIREGVDVALRAQVQLEDSSLVAVPLMVIERVVCAAPSYWAKHGRPRVPSELARLNCLPYLLGSDAALWRFDGPTGRHHVKVQGNFRTDNSLLLIDALVRGVGVSLVPTVMVRALLAAGSLEAVLPDYGTEARELYAVYPSRAHLPEKVRAFVAFLRERLAAEGRRAATGGATPPERPERSRPARPR
jgi:DNA-binding transcriptional LysR family regulator